MTDARPLLVTSALPYANGPIHLGHLVENTQSDIFVRFQRLVGRDVLFVCAADTHGTPIEVNARKQGVAPAVMVERFRQEHHRDFTAFGISFDSYESTNSAENMAFAVRIYQALKAAGHVFEAPLEQFYDEEHQRFLPDRFVKGTCPNCGAKDQYGDVCESCGKTYSPTELKEPYSILSKKTPVRKTSTHLFVRLADFTEFLRAFVDRLQPEVRNSLEPWLAKGLAAWCISRNGPYFGFQIPETDKYFYVWLDAPVGYVSSAAIVARKRGLDLARYWPGTGATPATGSEPAEIVHFIGKDIVYFHTLFWPAMLEAAGFALPNKVHVHGMLNLGGAKMSKSRGKLITAREWLDAFDPSYLRYYLAANLGPGLDDIEFTTEELRNRVNSQLVNNVGNLSNRVLKFVAANFEGRLSEAPALDEAERTKLEGHVASAKAAFAALDFRTAIKNIEAVGGWANEVMQTRAPFRTVKTDPARAQADVTLLANVLKSLATMLLPVVPKFAAQMLAQLNVKVSGWDQGVAWDLRDHRIGTPTAILPPIDDKALEALFAAKEPAVTTPPVPAPAAADSAPAFEELKPEISIDDFGKVDLRVGVVRAAERIPKADKLLKLSVDIGEPEPRTILAGIALAYAPEELVGRRVVVVANLAPRAMRGFESRGMLLAAGGGPKGLLLADIPGESTPGTRVK
jgi:methionyl-tRNA synthetase